MQNFPARLCLFLLRSDSLGPSMLEIEVVGIRDQAGRGCRGGNSLHTAIKFCIFRTYSDGRPLPAHLERDG